VLTQRSDEPECKLSHRAYRTSPDWPFKVPILWPKEARWLGTGFHQEVYESCLSQVAFSVTLCPNPANKSLVKGLGLSIVKKPHKNRSFSKRDECLDQFELRECLQVLLSFVAQLIFFLEMRRLMTGNRFLTL
jgi:hypothetical protein